MFLKYNTSVRGIKRTKPAVPSAATIGPCGSNKNANSFEKFEQASAPTPQSAWLSKTVVRGGRARSLTLCRCLGLFPAAGW
ncbi:exported hypothetical protein [Candidatus Sulfopaludibacter sp. SbA4]|nr:exported hypothetical protein [Candidatus Sulfopaludibacter sp. SbA4]